MVGPSFSIGKSYISLSPLSISDARINVLLSILL